MEYVLITLLLFVGIKGTFMAIEQRVEQKKWYYKTKR